MKEIIASIINEWDPIGIKTITPDDEYDLESSQIESAILENANITEKELAEVIKNVFDVSFDSVFAASKKEIDKISSKILTACKQAKEKEWKIERKD